MTPGQNLTDAQTHNAHGLSAVQANRPDLAAEHFARAASLCPNIPEFHGNLGNALLTIGQPAAAAAAYRKAIDLRPNVAEFHHCLGCALHSAGQLDSSLAAFQQSCILKPQNAKFHHTLAVTLYDLARFDEATAELNLALKLQPDYAPSHWTLGIIQLLRGDYAHGWPEFDWRWKCDSTGLARTFSAPLWNGEDLAGKTILLHAEQGLGDTIQFIRYAPMVAQRGARVILECQTDLTRLLDGFPGVQQIIPRDQPLPPFDFHCPLMRLPMLLGTTPITIPFAAPYLHPTPFPRSFPSGFRVGLVWAGRPEHQNDRNRSLRLAQFSSLANLPGVHFFTLQKGPAAAQSKTPLPNLPLIDWTDQLTDMADTASLLASLDAMITVDTAIAHLAGAMGKTTALLLPLVPDWRWMLDRNDTPWYPSLRLFRQQKRADWTPVIEEVCNWLKVMKPGCQT